MSEPTPQSNAPDPLVWATVHVYHTCSRLVDFLDQCGDCRTLDGAPACSECEDATGALFALSLIACSLESNQKGHRAIRRAEKRLMDKRIAAIERKVQERKAAVPCSLPCPLSQVTFSNN